MSARFAFGLALVALLPSQPAGEAACGKVSMRVFTVLGCHLPDLDRLCIFEAVLPEGEDLVAASGLSDDDPIARYCRRVYWFVLRPQV